MYLIRNIIEPRRLILAWHGTSSETRRHAIAEIVRMNDGTFTFSYLKGSEDFLKAQKNGFDSYKAFPDIEKTYTENVLDIFINRLPPRKRGDFDLYMEQIGLDPSLKHSISDFSLLGYSGAKLATDEYELVNPLEDIHAPAEFILQAAGVRHRDKEAIESAQTGDSLSLLPEPDNEHDPDAIKIVDDQFHIGYINKLQTRGVAEILKKFSVSISLSKKNGTPDNPKIFVFLSIL